MKNIKLYIGEVEDTSIKLPWVPTLDSVIATQKFLKNKYKYSTVIILRKNINSDINFPMTNNVVYTSSQYDLEVQHIGSTGAISVSGNYDYFDGTYYYSYIVMYSNTLNIWNVTNNSSIYAIKYDQSNVVIVGGLSYIMNEFRITKNVTSLTISGGVVSNVGTLILPNQLSKVTEYATYSLFNPLNKFQLFNVANYISGQEVESYDGLLYSVGLGMLLAVPTNYSGDASNNIVLSDLCEKINTTAFNDGSTGNCYQYPINQIKGSNVQYLEAAALAFTNIKVVRFPILFDIKDEAFLQSKVEQLLLPNTLRYFGNNVVEECEELTTVLLEQGFDCTLVLNGANNINGINFGSQLYNLLPNIKPGERSITIMPEVFNNIPQEDIDYATSINWEIISI